jgi:predicted RNA-binding protein with PIN domain
VIYTRLGDTADSVIKTIVGKRKSEWIVVTSDRDIASFAWASGSVPVPSGQFQLLLEKAVRGSSAVSDSSDEGDAPGEFTERGKGRSRTPSKKEKAVNRVLKKL